MIKLEVLNSAFKGKRFSVKDGVTVGSGPQAVIRAQHPEMQELHARFYTEAGKQMVEAVGDKSRIYINNKDVMRTTLRHNDELQIGPLRFKVLDDNMTSSSGLRLDELMEEMENKADDDILDFAKDDLFYLTTKDPTLRERIAFSLPSKDRFIDQAQVFLARLVKQCGMDEEQVEAFMTCAKELILNAHRHGHKYDESKTMIIRYRDFGDRIQVSIEDQGPGFDHKALLNSVRAKDAATAARERYQAGGFGGLGFQLITRMASELAYNDSGSKVTFAVTKKPKE